METRLIDANALKEKMTVGALGGHLRIWVCGVIDDAPTVNAVPVKRGKWIIYNLYAQCSECSVAYDFDTFQRLIPMNEKFPRHCSYCGAYMIYMMGLDMGSTVE